jgi:hypothetical protein
MPLPAIDDIDREIARLAVDEAVALRSFDFAARLANRLPADDLRAHGRSARLLERDPLAPARGRAGVSERARRRRPLGFEAVREIGLALSVLLAACSTLPEHARPRAELVDPASYRATDAIRYRALTRADFRATEPPKQVAAHANSFGAFTCASVVPEGMTRVRLEPAHEPGIYVATLENAAFHAEMDRGCSWWNPAGTPVPKAYVLEHEQIHFALTEIQARRLGAAMREVRLRTDAPQSAGAELERRYHALLETAMAELLRRSTEFDEDTSGSYEPEQQARWLARVESELARTGPSARATQP